MNDKISLFRIPVCSKYTDAYLSISVLRPVLTPNCSVIKGTIIRTICTESVQVLTLRSATIVGVTGLSKLCGCFFDLLPCFFFYMLFTELASASTVVAS